jgi:hypothetical protein
MHSSQGHAVPLKDFELIKYNFLREELLTYTRGVIAAHTVGGPYYTSRTRVGNITDFYAIGDILYYVRNDLPYKRSGNLIEQIHVPVKNGKFQLFYVPSSSADRTKAISFVVLLLAYLI